MLDVATPYSGLVNRSYVLPKLNRRVAVTVLVVYGEVDAHTSNQLARDLQRCDEMKRPVMIDLTALDFLDVRGLRVLIDFDNQCREQGIPLALVTCPLFDRLFSLAAAEYPPQRVDSQRAALWWLRGDILRSGRQRMPLTARAALRC